MQSKLAKYLAAVAFAGVVGAQAAAPATPQGVITAKEFLGITGTAVANLTASPKFPDNPDVTSYSPQFEWPINTADPSSPPPGDVRNDYGTQIIGYFYPETSGSHSFYISADDGAVLYLSTDDTAANKVSIATEPTWNGVRDYMGTARRPVADVNTGRLVNQSAPINLVAGRAYYIEALAKEGGGGDNLSVAVVMEGETPTVPIPGEQLSSIEKTSGPVSITTQPLATTVAEGQPATLRVVADGTPPYTYQWLRNGQEIAGATSESYTIASATLADNNANYTVRITNNGGGNTVTSSAATLTVTSDTIAPTVVSARGNRELNSVTVVYSEPVQASSATTVGNYSLSPNVAITAATLVNPTTVRLTTGAQTPNTAYTLNVSNVRDASVASNPVAAGTSAAFKSWVRGAGFLTIEFFRDIPNVGLGDLIAADKYVNNQPDEIRYTGTFQTPDNYGDNYGARVTGWLVPKVTGDYNFFIRADDQAALFINPDGEALPDASDPFAAQASETSGCCEAFKEPDGFSTETTLAPIHLVAGQKYGVVFLMKEAGGGDWSQVAWRLEGDTTAASALQPMSADLFETWMDPTGAAISVTTPPASVTTQENRTVTFSPAVTLSTQSVAYQWLKNGQPIAGATGLTYTTPILALADNNTKYSLRIRVPGLETTSAEATVTVVPDTFAPVVVGAGAVRHGSNWEVTVLLDEKLSTATAPTIANFTIPGVTFTGVTIVTNASGLVNPQSAVVLTTTGLTAGNSYTVTVNGLRDAKGNAMTAAGTATFNASPLTFAAIGNDNDWSDPAVVAVGTQEYHLVSGGASFWGNTDDVTFLYEEITGDFDKVVRVVSQDPSSQWARAGLTAREAVNEGVYDAAEASRYQNAHANPTTMYTGAPANNGYEGNRRVETGGATDGAGGSAGTTYPNTWIRLKREGNTIIGFRSSDGTAWTQYLSTDFTTVGSMQPLNAKLYVGMVYGPEAGNVADEQDAAWAAVFRDYGNFVAAPANGPITITQGANGALTLSWTGAGTLESATALNGTWSAVTGVTGTSYSTTTTGGARFFRIRRN